MIGKANRNQERCACGQKVRASPNSFGNTPVEYSQLANNDKNDGLQDVPHPLIILEESGGTRKLWPYEDLINSAAQANSLSPDLLARIVRIESGNNPYARTGSYHGLLQLNQPEFKRYNPTGDIYDPAANLNAGAAKLAGEIATFRQNYGREPTPTDIYMTHQQGQGGYAAHTANPNGAAWMNMATRPPKAGRRARTGPRLRSGAISPTISRRSFPAA